MKKMKALIDGDLLSYEVSSCGQLKDELTGETIIKSFDSVSELLDQKIKEIVAESFSDEEPRLYLTGDEMLLYHVNRARVRNGDDIKVFTPNFRHEVAKTKPYKGNRHQEKPYHFHNLRAYMLSQYDCVVTDGIEADDLICIDMYKDKDNTICCTRDKDLRMCPGWHYGWACGKQPSFGPELVDELGRIELSSGSSKKIKGTGILFFYSQLITGDTVDNIPGLPKRGPVYAYNLLSECKSEIDCYNAVTQAYEEHYGKEAWEDVFREQVDLLWMIREINEDGSLKFYKYPEGGDLLADQKVS